VIVLLIFSYIRICECEGAPHLLTRYVSNKLALREIAYQIVSVGDVSFLSRSQKRQWPSFPISLRIFTLSNAKHAQREVEQTNRIWLAHGNFKKHDPTKIFKKHCSTEKISQSIHA
jgi:hypothetical protein